jgi:hypothetical protein
VANHPLAATAIREIEELHAFLEGWLGGTGADSAAAFARIEGALSPGFTMVTPAGERLSRAEILGWLRGAHGSRRDPAPFRIRIEAPEVLHCEPPLVLVSYVEAQARGQGQATERNARRSLVLLRGADEAPAGMSWIAIQETWLST